MASPKKVIYLRISLDLHQTIGLRAYREGTSINAMLVEKLHQLFMDEHDTTTAATADKIEAAHKLQQQYPRAKMLTPGEILGEGDI